MPTDPREPTAVTVDTEVPRGLADTLLTALVEAAEDLGVGVIGTYRPTAEAQAELDEPDRLRARVAERDETIGELKEELALTQRVAAAADHLLAGREIQPTTINTWLAHRFRTGLEARTAELATAQQRVDKLEAAAVANARRWTQELGRLGLRANTADTQLAAALDRLDQVRGELATTQHDHAAATARIRDLRAAATAAHQCADAAEAQVRELTELNIKMAANGLTFGRQRDGAEAQVAAVRQAIDQLTGTREFQAGPYWNGWDDALGAVENALDGASMSAPTQQAREPSTAEHGSWKPEIFPIVDALRGIDWTGFNPSSLDDLADIAGVIAGELFPPDAAGPPPETSPTGPPVT